MSKRTVASIDTIPRPFRPAARLALKAGWVILHTGSGHLIWLPPNSDKQYITSHSPGKGRSTNNTLAKLRSAGLGSGKRLPRD